MNLSNRIYSRKVLYRLLYMYNFSKSILSKNIYLNFADKVDNIVKHGLDKIEVSEYDKFDFSKLIYVKNQYSKKLYDIKDYISSFDPRNEEEFNDILSYTSSFFVINKQESSIDYQYIVNNMIYLIDNFSDIVKKIDENLNTFKFFELNSIDQSILLLGFIEPKTTGTHKSVIIKECNFLSSTFTSENSIKLINAVLDKVIE